MYFSSEIRTLLLLHCQVCQSIFISINLHHFHIVLLVTSLTMNQIITKAIINMLGNIYDCTYCFMGGPHSLTSIELVQWVVSIISLFFYPVIHRRDPSSNTCMFVFSWPQDFGFALNIYQYHISEQGV